MRRIVQHVGRGVSTRCVREFRENLRCALCGQSIESAEVAVIPSLLGILRVVLICHGSQETFDVTHDSMRDGDPWYSLMRKTFSRQHPFQKDADDVADIEDALRCSVAA